MIIIIMDQKTHLHLFYYSYEISVQLFEYLLDILDHIINIIYITAFRIMTI